MKDPFDEFEFKPITDGLGFHKKKSEFKVESQLDPILKDSGLDLLETNESAPFSTPLPRKSFALETKTLVEETTTSAVDEILKTLQNNKRLDFDSTKESLKANATEQFTKATVSGQAIFLDAMLVIAGSLMCMISLLLITRVDLIGNLTNPQSSAWIYAATASIFALVTIVYMTFNRFIMGSTPGEWAFDQRIGKPEEQTDYRYGFKVALRSVVNIVTGFVVLPIISNLLNKDIAGQISGARLYKKV